MGSSPFISIPSSSPSIFIRLLLLLSLLQLTIHRAEAQTGPNYLDHYCTNDDTFSPNSTYQINRDAVLSALSSNTSDYVSGFTSIQEGNGSSSDRVYGLFLCRGDQSPGSCRDCVADGAQRILQSCPDNKGSNMWYEECWVTISDQSFRSTISESLYLTQESGTSSDPIRFNTLLNTTLSSLISTTASSQLPGRKFAVQKENFIASQPLYTLAQCTPDLSPTDCSMCLQMAYNVLHRGNRTAKYVKPTCSLWYDDYAFYNETAVALLLPTAPTPTPPSPGPSPNGNRKISTAAIIAIVVAIVGITIAGFLIACCLLRRRGTRRHEIAEDASSGSDITAAESIQFDFAVIQAATDNFCDENKLGEGGFGKVYRGVLPTGKVVAVKRLSRSSAQGTEEFKNEVVVVAKLQHRNLVRLLGFCLKGEERILVYEYVPNKSLDYFLFDPKKWGLLDWSMRYKIISGIARGMLYLHEDSQLKVVHRDLKTSNVLLDADMNPKISDFGMARIFGMDQTHETTNKVVGTRGYMSPEYTMHGRFSTKSDVYSFGVVALEIISGEKNSSFCQSGETDDLPSYAWKHCRDGTPMEVLDPILRGDSCSKNEVIKCINMCLQCLQEDPADRPTMATIVVLLNSYSVTLPVARRPASFLGAGSTSPSTQASVNEVTLTEAEPR